MPDTDQRTYLSDAVADHRGAFGGEFQSVVVGLAHRDPMGLRRGFDEVAHPGSVSTRAAGNPGDICLRRISPLDCTSAGR